MNPPPLFRKCQKGSFFYAIEVCRLFIKTLLYFYSIHITFPWKEGVACDKGRLIIEVWRAHQNIFTPYLLYSWSELSKSRRLGHSFYEIKTKLNICLGKQILLHHVKQQILVTYIIRARFKRRSEEKNLT